MDFNQVKDLIKTIDSSDFMEFELQLGDTYVRMSKNAASPATANPLPQKPVKKLTPTDIISETIEEPITILPDETPEAVDGNIVSAPIVGTFYNSPSTDSPSFVKVGDTVKKGDVLCIVEAMKVMNEIKSGFDGKVAEIFVEQEQMVEYNQPLFRIVTVS